MKIIKIIILLIVIQTSVAMASSLQVTPSTLDVNLTKDVSKTIQVNVTNPNNFTLYDLKVEGVPVVDYSIIESI